MGERDGGGVEGADVLAELVAPGRRRPPKGVLLDREGGSSTGVSARESGQLLPWGNFLRTPNLLLDFKAGAEEVVGDSGETAAGRAFAWDAGRGGAAEARAACISGMALWRDAGFKFRLVYHVIVSDGGDSLWCSGKGTPLVTTCHNGHTEIKTPQNTTTNAWQKNLKRQKY
ncbi:hypothetical protein DFH06DRAFT_1131118 [Mycena polygramma]|nr:hypothetical protein DFH06DRAFT_1131118 [Mycena polygramma]